MYINSHAQGKDRKLQTMTFDISAKKEMIYAKEESKKIFFFLDFLRKTVTPGEQDQLKFENQDDLIARNIMLTATETNRHLTHFP